MKTIISICFKKKNSPGTNFIDLFVRFIKYKLKLIKIYSFKYIDHFEIIPNSQNIKFLLKEKMFLTKEILYLNVWQSLGILGLSSRTLEYMFCDFLLKINGSFKKAKQVRHLPLFSDLYHLPLELAVALSLAPCSYYYSF